MKTRKLKCIVTGKVLFATADYYARKLERVEGDVDKLHNTYVCKEAKDILAAGKTYLRGITSEQVPGLVNNVVHKTDPEVREFLDRITAKTKY